MRGSTETRAGERTDEGKEGDAGIGVISLRTSTATDQHAETAVKLNAKKGTASEKSTTTETHGETT
jgi:hypothetical protein